MNNFSKVVKQEINNKLFSDYVNLISLGFKHMESIAILTHKYNYKKEGLRQLVNKILAEQKQKFAQLSYKQKANRLPKDISIKIVNNFLTK